MIELLSLFIIALAPILGSLVAFWIFVRVQEWRADRRAIKRSSWEPADDHRPARREDER
jgi:hypothetical protein